MAARKDAVLNSYDDDTAVNVGGSWSNQESSHDDGVYTYSGETNWNYAGYRPGIDKRKSGLSSPLILGVRP